MAKIKNRTLEYLKASGITKQDFCEKTGISYSNMVGKSLQSELGGDQIYEILHNFPDLNSDWLLLGRGEMLRSQSTPQPSHDDFFTHLLAEKDKKIEALVRENERLSIDLQREREKSSSQLAPTAFA